jgi:hypothetical protein
LLQLEARGLERAMQTPLRAHVRSKLDWPASLRCTR